MPVVYTGMYKGERFNSISHLVAPALALAGSAVLVAFAAMDGDTRINPRAETLRVMCHQCFDLWL
jgi:predicted membrane channel-forming protein YqfA (hemolysin III family)